MSYQQFVETYKIMYRKPDGCGFKMNMFPIRFKGRKDVKWDELLGKATGFDSFHAYREWCVTHRGEFFREQMRKNQPKLVMCTGVEEGVMDKMGAFFETQSSNGQNGCF